MLLLHASVARVDGGGRVNVAQLAGVDHGFWRFSQSSAEEYRALPPDSNPLDAPNLDALPAKREPEFSDDLTKDTVFLNERLARQLNVSPGDTVVVRVEKPGTFSRDAPLSGESNEVVALRVTVAKVVGDKDFGRFALTASQIPPYTVFMRLAELQRKLGLRDIEEAPSPAMVDAVKATGMSLEDFLDMSGRGRVNAMIGNAWSGSIHFDNRIRWRSFSIPVPWAVADMINGKRNFEIAQKMQFEWFQEGIQSGLQLTDASLELRELPNNFGLELRTPRVFLDSPVVAVAPQGKDNRRVDALTYFVNELRAGEKTTPYSMVTGVETASSGFLPAELADNEIVISQWLADDLGITTGAEVTLKYFVMGERRQLTEQSRKFTVLAVLPMNEPQLNGSWMPDFPGLSDKDNCREWEPGFDFDATRIRDEDQAYWDKYRGTPKAFVNLKVGQEMWGNRWGKVTAMRWPGETKPAEIDSIPPKLSEIEQELKAKLTPEMLGFQFLQLRDQADAATKAPVDFGELFVSFSFFLIVAAAVLTGMLFTFSLEQRNAEAGLLLALGLRVKQVRRLFLWEGAVLALVGGLLGAAAAVLYTRLVLRALGTVWRGAVGTTDFVLTVQAGTLFIGVLSGVIVAVLAMWWASRKQLRRTARELLTDTALEEPAKSYRRGRRFTSVLSVLPFVLFPAALLMAALAKGSPPAFFGAGSLLLIAGLLGCRWWLRRLAVVRTEDALPSLSALGIRNATRQRGRSIATIAVLACGVFMVVAVDAFRERPLTDTTRQDTGTGGFALVGESSLPIYDDLNTAKGREAFALDEKIMEGVHVVPLRVRDGDDASCLNLNRALQPRILGVRPDDLKGRFRFAGRVRGVALGPDGERLGEGWEFLSGGDAAAKSGTVVGITDANTLQWALQKKTGDTLQYRDERGGDLSVLLLDTVVGSLLQGNVLISEKHFIEKFPGNGGYRYFLIDCPPEKITAVREHLSRQLADRGLELMQAAQRLADFQAVQNTYLSIFQALGGLGLLLGSVGLAIVVARNVLERRREFGLLEAVGFRKGQLRALVFAEHRWLIVCGLMVGTVSAVIGVWPGLRERAGGFPFLEMGVLWVGLAVGSLFWAWLATRLALRGSGVAALRSE
jgi:ABC-type lipoprotein release transport system permease subunit